MDSSWLFHPPYETPDLRQFQGCLRVRTTGVSYIIYISYTRVNDGSHGRRQKDSVDVNGYDLLLKIHK